MKVGIHLTGSIGQSTELYQARNKFKRGLELRGSTVTMQIRKDSEKLIELQENLGFDLVMDPLLDQYYLFQPIVEYVHGVENGMQENWFNNNVFCWRPIISGPLDVQTGFTEHFLNLDLLTGNGDAMVVLPSPFTFLEYSVVNGYQSNKEAIVNIAELIHAEAQHLVSLGFKRIQYDEPAIAYRQQLGSLTQEHKDLLTLAMEICGRVQGAATSLHTYFGNTAPIITYLSGLPVDCIGIDCTETDINDVLGNHYNGKELALGLINARTRSMEDPEKIVEQLNLVRGKTDAGKIWLVPNTATEYIGERAATKKMELLSIIRGRLYD